MRWSVLVLPVALAACQPTVPPSSSATSIPGAVQFVQDKNSAPMKDVPKELHLQKVLASRVAIGESIWLETQRTPETACSLVIGDALNILGSSLAAGAALPARLPKQPPVAWQLRHPEIPVRVVLDLEVAARMGFLEHLISRTQAAKDHESVLSGPFDAEQLHLALVAIGLKPGKTASFVNENREYDFKPATGDSVKIFLQYEDDQGKTITVPAQTWIARAKDGKTLAADWVFAGSYRGKFKNFEGEEVDFFGANDGRVVCVTNFGSALLDLPFESIDSTPEGDNLGFKANTQVIPPQCTKVRVLMEPQVKAKAPK